MSPTLQYPGSAGACSVDLIVRVYDNLGNAGDPNTGIGTITASAGFAPAVVNLSCATQPNLCDDAIGAINNGSQGETRTFTFTYTGTGGAASFVLTNTVAGTTLFAPAGTVNTPAVTMPDCTGGGPVIPGGSVPGGSSATPVPPPFVDPGVQAERAQGIERVYFNAASKLIVYNQPYGYQFYTWTGEVVGLVNMTTATIPGPGGLISSMSSGQWRVDFYYIGGDNVQANLYQNGALLEEARFNISGLAGRSTGGLGQNVPSFGGGTEVVQGQSGGSGGTGSVSSPAVVAEVVCRQNLRQDASTDTPVMDVLAPGAALTVVGRSNDNSWLNVTTGNGLTGWIFNGQCVNTGSVPVFQAPVQVVFENQATVDNQGVVVQPSDPSVAAASPASPVVNVVCRQNLRLGPGTDYATNRVLEVGSALSVVGRSADGSWLQVSGGDAAGWVYFGQCVLPQVGDVTSAPVTVALGG